MTTNFPTSLDTLANPQPSTPTRSPNPLLRHARQHQDANDAIEALQAKVGIDSSAVTSSLDYKIAQLQSTVTTLSGTVGTNSSNISTLQGQMTTANSNISTLQGQMTAVLSGLAIVQNQFGDWLASGQPTFQRELSNGTCPMTTSGNLRLAYFTAKQSFTTTGVRMFTASGGAAGATPSLIRVGLWTADSAGAGLSLVASTASDTTLFAAASTEYNKAWQASYNMVAGQRYALGILVVSAAAMPTLIGTAMGITAEAARAPMLSAFLTGQANLPASWAAGSLTTSTNRHYSVCT